MDNLNRGELAFDDLGALLDSNSGFDLSRGTWKRTGWRELDKLRKVGEWRGEQQAAGGSGRPGWGGGSRQHGSPCAFAESCISLPCPAPPPPSTHTSVHRHVSCAPHPPHTHLCIGMYPAPPTHPTHICA